MRTAMYTFLMTLLLGISSGNAQMPYEEAMKKAFSLWEEQKATEAGNLFAKIAEAEEDNWLPYYYAAQIKITQSFNTTDSENKQLLLRKAEELLAKAKGYRGVEDVELMLLQAMLHTAYVAMDPMTYGARLSPVIARLHKTVAQKAPGNPRAALVRAEWNIGAAAYFGEDPGQYCDDLKASLVLFEASEAGNDFAPSWGEARARSLISRTCE